MIENNLVLERKRLGLKSGQVAEYVGVTPTSMSNYEKGKRRPDFGVLAKMLELGYDINFVMTGKRNSNHLTTEEQFLLDKFRQADQRKQQMVLGMLIMDDAEIPRAVAGELGKGRGSQVGKNTIGDISQSKIGDISQK